MAHRPFTAPMQDVRMSDVLIIAADHPSLGGDIDDFLDRVQREQRYFGPSARTNPKPSRTLVDALRRRGGFRMAAMLDGRIVGLARIDGAGELFIAVGPGHRGVGIGTALGRAAAERARELHYGRIMMRSTRRSRAARRVGEALGCIIVDRERGRTDLIIDLGRFEQIA